MTPSFNRRLANASQRWPVSLLIVLLWLVLVLPSAYLNRLFTLDCGGIFNLAAGFPTTLHWIVSPYNDSGRYFPFYWLYYVFIYHFFSVNTVAYYLVQSGIFLATALTLGHLFESFASRGLIAMCFGVALFLSGPNAETLYTIGKAEPLTLFFIALILYQFHRHTDSSQLSIPKCLSIGALFALAVWSKETSLALFSFAMTGLAVTYLFNWNRALTGKRPLFLAPYVRLLLSLIFGLAMTRIPYLIFASEKVSTASYTTFSTTVPLIAENVFFYLTQQPDVAGFGIIATVLTCFILRSVWSSPTGQEPDLKAHTDLIFVISLLVMAWAYLGIFLIWRWPMGYYLFLPGIIFRFAAGYGLYVALQRNLLYRRGRMVCYASMILLLTHATLYLWYAGASQSTYSRMYTAALQEYAHISLDNDSLIFESYPFYSEQVTGSDQVVTTVFHKHRRLYGIADLVNPAVITPAMRQLLGVTDEALHDNEAHWPRKDDYVLAFTGNLLGTWQIRGVAPFYSDGSDLQRDGGYEMRLLADAKQSFPAAFINLWTHWPGVQDTYVGYQIYQVLSGPRFTWLGKYPDGWMGTHAKLTLYPAYVSRAVVHISTSKYNPKNSVRVLEDGIVVNQATLTGGKEQTIELKAKASDSPTVFEFEVERTFVPKKNHLNDDTRELGALVLLEPFAATRSRDISGYPARKNGQLTLGGEKPQGKSASKGVGGHTPRSREILRSRMDESLSEPGEGKD